MKTRILARTSCIRAIAQEFTSRLAFVKHTPDWAAVCKLFVEAQFASFPAEWCKANFGTAYPPQNVVFGTNAIARYRTYVRSGSRQPLVVTKKRKRIHLDFGAL